MIGVLDYLIKLVWHIMNSESLGQVEVGKLKKNTKFLFYRDDPFRRWAERLQDWLNFQACGLTELNFISLFN